MPRKNGQCVSCGHQHAGQPSRFPTPDCGLKRPCLRLLGVRPFGTRAGWIMLPDGGSSGDSVADKKRKINGARARCSFLPKSLRYYFSSLTCSSLKPVALTMSENETPNSNNLRAVLSSASSLPSARAHDMASCTSSYSNTLFS